MGKKDQAAAQASQASAQAADAAAAPQERNAENAPPPGGGSWRHEGGFLFGADGSKYAWSIELKDWQLVEEQQPDQPGSNSDQPQE